MSIFIVNRVYGTASTLPSALSFHRTEEGARSEFAAYQVQMEAAGIRYLELIRFNPEYMFDETLEFDEISVG
jgi:hypothetical protein